MKYTRKTNQKSSGFTVTNRSRVLFKLTHLSSLPRCPAMESFYDPITLTFTAFAMLLCLFTLKIFATKTPPEEQKKRRHPIAGTIFNQLLNFSRLHHYMTELASKYGTYRLSRLSRSEIYTADPANVEYILKTNFANYGKGKHNNEILRDLLGDGIFAVDGEKWRQQRKLSSYEFSSSNLRGFSSTVFRRNAANLAKILLQAATSGLSFDIQDLFMKSTLDSIFKVGFGVELDSSGGSTDGTMFAKAFDDSSALTLWRYVDVFWKMKKFLNVGSEAELRENVKMIDKFVYRLISYKIQQKQNCNTTTGSHMKKQDILSRFLELNETDPKYLRDIIMNFIIAGRDTTATTLSWFFYMLCKHPYIQEKIAQEVQEAIKEKDTSSYDELADNLNDESLGKMHYLHAAISETLRLYPAIPVDMKVCFSDDTLPDGFNVKKGDMVAYQPYAMGRMKSIWGDDAEVFRPERWLNESGLFRQESQFKFTAFQAGPRICLGKDFAYRQMKIFSALLLSSFVFRLSDDQKEVGYRTMITLNIDGGLHLQVSHRLGCEHKIYA